VFWWTLEALAALKAANPAPVATTGITTPIAATWIYMSDDQNYTTIPQTWSNINFRPVDVLFVGPGGVQADGTFGLYNSTETGPLAHRFEWVLDTARRHNPDIKIIISQWWGNGTGVFGDTINSLETNRSIDVYAESVGKFVEEWHLDGYDVDYENGNLREDFGVLAKGVRGSLDKASQASGGKPLYFTVSPVITFFLEEAVKYIDYVNAQTYAGGISFSSSIGDFFNLGFKPEQILYGMCVEDGCQSPSLEKVQEEYVKGKLAGIHLWRLNSDNMTEQALTQAKIHAFLHPPKQ
jgi:hypothetical protein